MMQFINKEIQDFALKMSSASISQGEFIEKWRHACEHAARGSMAHVVIREHYYNLEGEVGGHINENEQDTYAAKGALLLAIEWGNARYNRAGSSHGWKLYFLETGNLLFLDFKSTSDVTHGWNVGRDEDAFDLESTQIEVGNDLPGLAVLVQRFDDLRKQLQIAAYDAWHQRGRPVNGDALSDWLAAKSGLDIPHDVYI